MTIYVTGDTHGDFSHLFELQFHENKFKPEDTLIILGDSGINFYCHQIDKNTGEKITYNYGEEPVLNDNTIYKEENRPRQLKKAIVTNFPCTVLCIHGNHEARPEHIKGYKEKEWNGGMVYYQPGFENILFAKDGEIYDIEGKQYIAIGGAYSVDKEYRILLRYNWFPDEQPSDEIKERVEKKLEENNWKIHGVLSHTCPYNYEPRELFLAQVDQSKVDDSTERWLQTIDDRLDYEVWYFGHFHGYKQIDTSTDTRNSTITMLFHEIETAI